MNATPARYRSLLATYPRAWRREHGEAMLGILLDAHAAQGRDRPRLSDRAWFALDGVRVRAERLVHHRAPRRFAESSALAGFHSFDQQNGTVAPTAETSAAQQTAANVADGCAGALPQVAWGSLFVRG